MAARGSVIKRDRPGQESFWEVTISKGVDKLTGRRLREYKSFKTEKEANRWLAARLVEIDRGTAVDRSRMTVAELMSWWLESYAKSHVSEVTLAGYEDTVRLHIVPYLGAAAVQDLKAVDITNTYTKLRKAGVGARSVQLVHLRLKQALQYALRHDLVARNVALAVQAPKVVRKERIIWSNTEIARFLEVAKDSSYSPIWHLSLASGLRRSELLALRWSDVLWHQECIQVRRKAVRVLSQVIIKDGTKSTASRRTVAIPLLVMDMLRCHRIKQDVLGFYGPQNLVFTSNVGTLISPRNLARQCKRLMAQAGVPYISLHSQRHVHVTALLLAGVPLKLVSERVGHASTQVTAQVYAHTTPEAHREVANVVAQVLLACPVSDKASDNRTVLRELAVHFRGQRGVDRGSPR